METHTHHKAQSVSGGEAFAEDRELQRVGRPSLLKPAEQTEIRKYFDTVRQEGQNVDHEVMVMVIIQSPPGNNSNHPELTSK